MPLKLLSFLFRFKSLESDINSWPNEPAIFVTPLLVISILTAARVHTVTSDINETCKLQLPYNVNEFHLPQK